MAGAVSRMSASAAYASGLQFQRNSLSSLLILLSAMGQMFHIKTMAYRSVFGVIFQFLLKLILEVKVPQPCDVQPFDVLPQ